MPTLFYFLSRGFWPGVSVLTILTALPTAAQAGRPTGTLFVGGGNVTPAPPGTATISAAGTVATGNYQFSFDNGPATSTYQTVDVEQSGTVNLENGGAVTGVLFNQYNSVSNIYGGSVQTLQSLDSSVANIYGGTVSSVQALGSSIGGVPGSGTINIYGGSLTKLDAEATGPGAKPAGTIDIFGTDLAETYLGSSFAPAYNAPSALFQMYSLTGTLQDGTALHALYSSSNGTLLFNGLPAVPEASTTVSFGLLLALGLSGMIARKKRRTA